MNKHEFLTKVKCINGKEPNISDNDYKIIEYVYTWHPCIDSVRGKEQIAYLFSEFGFRIIEDMLATANMAESAEKEMLAAREAYEAAVKKYQKLKQGNRSNT